MNMDFALNGLIEDADIASFGLIASVLTAKDFADEDFEQVIQILDESGEEVNITRDKFIEVVDQHGLSGLIL